jgi:hypothetical protein
MVANDQNKQRADIFTVLKAMNGSKFKEYEYAFAPDFKLDDDLMKEGIKLIASTEEYKSALSFRAYSCVISIGLLGIIGVLSGLCFIIGKWKHYEGLVFCLGILAIFAAVLSHFIAGYIYGQYQTYGDYCEAVSDPTPRLT